MSAKHTGLGRGFDSLIPDQLFDESFDPTLGSDGDTSDLRLIKRDEIVADPDQPRRQFDEIALAELAASVREHGILQPIVVTPYKGGYRIVAGERRYRAAGIAELDKIPAIVRTLSDQHRLEISLIENLQREDLNVIETATAYAKLRDQFNLSLDEIGKRVGGRSTSTVSNTIRLLKLPAPVLEALRAGALAETQARPLINLDEAQIAAVFPVILREGWSVRKIEQYVNDLRRNDGRLPKRKQQKVTTAHQDEATKLHGRLSTDVEVRTNSRGAGVITIKFKNDEDFERIAKLLGE